MMFNIPKSIKDISQLPDLFYYTLGGSDYCRRTKNYSFKIVKTKNSIYAEDWIEEQGISFGDFYKFTPVVKHTFNIFLN